MIEISLNLYQSAALGAVILCLGLFLVKKSPTLRKFCIPAAVAGGLIFSIANCILHYSDIAEFEFDETLKNVFMMAFFCSIGFMASLQMLKSGGKLVITLLMLALALLIIQDIVGVSFATLFGYDSKLGLCLGSISLVGGHGTAASYGVTLAEDFGLTSAPAVATAAATFGLAISGFIGGPLARKRVKKHDLVPDADDIELSEAEEKKEYIENNRFLAALVLIAVCVGIGTYICNAFKELDVTVPVYFGAMIIAMVVRNFTDVKKIDLPLREISTLGWICLAVFLSMALMTMKLWQIADLAAMMVITIFVQVIIVALYAYFVVFKVMGSDYDAAAFLTATCGFGLGATPNAVANMEALVEEHGPAPTAFFVVPLVGSVFIDFLNAGVLTVFLNIL